MASERGIWHFSSGTYLVEVVAIRAMHTISVVADRPIWSKTEPAKLILALRT